MKKNYGFSFSILAIKFVLTKICNGGKSTAVRKAVSEQLENNGLYECKRK